VRRALSDFLEKQREGFPRFYFVGDDDLLEMIGAGGLDGLRRHLRKMFGGVESLDLQGSAAVAVLSPEGERLQFAGPV
jgi:dynein heavy chain 1